MKHSRYQREVARRMAQMRPRDKHGRMLPGALETKTWTPGVGSEPVEMKHSTRCIPKMFFWGVVAALVVFLIITFFI